MDPIPMDATLSISESTMDTPMQPPSIPEDPAPTLSIPDPVPASTIPDPIPQSMPLSVQSTTSQISTLIEAAPSISVPQQQQNLQNSQPQQPFLQQQSPQVSTPRTITTPTSTHPPPPFSNFHQNFSNSPPMSTNISSTPLPPLSTLPMSTSIQRSAIAIGVPASSSHPRSGPVPFSSFGPTPSFGQPFSGGLPHPSRGATGVSGSNTQTRPSLQEIQGIHMRPSLVTSTLNQQRPLGQQPVRSISQGISMPSSVQNLSNQDITRVSSVVSPTIGSAQNTQPLQQPWLVRSQHPSSFRPQIRTQVLQHRPVQQQQHYQIQQKQFQQQQKQQQISLQAQQQLIAKNQQSLAQQQLLSSRAASQKTQISGTVTPGSSVPAVDVNIGDADAGDSGNHIVRRKSIQELISQVDPSEKLDPEVEEILLNIADDFIESAITGACSLAKHRKSTTLESKDLLLHLERNWNMSLPGFGGEEIKGSNKRVSANDVHKDRLAAIKRSMTATVDAGNAKKGGNG